jgi:hypothetical protein
MSFQPLKALSLITVCLFAVFTTVHAEEWVRGAAAVTSVTGEVILEAVGGESLQLDSADSLPRYVSGLLKVRTQSKDAVFLKTSNRISIYNEGAGFFAIERFEQDVATSTDQGKSRMILNLRQGLLAVDNRALSSDSQMIVETALGRISVKNGWWLMEIVYDERSHLYDFSIECADGVLRFTDRGGDTYTLRNGQRLRGAGASSRPSIEVAGISEDAIEFFEEFAEMAAEATALELPAEAFRAQMQPLKHAGRTDSAPAETATARTTKRPLVIEYAPQSAPVTPFRAVIRPPSSYQADLF